LINYNIFCVFFSIDPSCWGLNLFRSTENNTPRVCNNRALQNLFFITKNVHFQCRKNGILEKPYLVCLCRSVTSGSTVLMHFFRFNLLENLTSATSNSLYLKTVAPSVFQYVAVIVSIFSYRQSRNRVYGQSSIHS